MEGTCSCTYALLGSNGVCARCGGWRDLSRAECRHLADVLVTHAEIEPALQRVKRMHGRKRPIDGGRHVA
jgi:hypothetical protein